MKVLNITDTVHVQTTRKIRTDCSNFLVYAILLKKYK